MCFSKFLLKLFSTKKLCLKYVEEKRQSFSERVCDDLSEVILQYLSLEDKLKLQFVSKQFQRTVFQRHEELIINCRDVRLMRERSFKLIEFFAKNCINVTSVIIRFELFKEYENIEVDWI